MNNRRFNISSSLGYFIILVAVVGLLITDTANSEQQNIRQLTDLSFSEDVKIFKDKNGYYLEYRILTKLINELTKSYNSVKYIAKRLGLNELPIIGNITILDTNKTYKKEFQLSGNILTNMRGVIEGVVLLEDFKLTSGNEYNITIALSIDLNRLDQVFLQEAMSEFLNKDSPASKKSPSQTNIANIDDTSTISSSAINENIILCKKAASNKWLLDYTMEHGRTSYEQKIEAIK